MIDLDVNDRAVASDAAPIAGVIDIGSNSVRLVVYRVGSRAPAILFNEKVMAGLGGGVAKGSELADDAMAVALAALSRFAAVTRAMGVPAPRAVATAAVRQATNGAAFCTRVRAETGIGIEIISGEEEARGSAYGVIAGIPDADGIVGDLGGGSLELIRVSGGEPHARASVPIGSLKLVAARADGSRALGSLIADALDAIPWLRDGAGRPFYTVGGSWRALAHFHMAQTNAPLSVIQQYRMAASAPEQMTHDLAAMGTKALRAIPGVATVRAPALPGAAALLAEVVRRAGSSDIVTSSYGLREGLLYAELAPEARRIDPLLAACADEAIRGARFADTGAALGAWIAPLFAADPPARARIRTAAALLSDIGWSTNPDFRSSRAVDTALHGPWVAITHEERALLAAALNACFGGEKTDIPGGGNWCSLAQPADLARADAWGRALRLGQRLGGGSAAPLARARLEAGGGELRLTLPPDLAALSAPVVRRRLKSLADVLGLRTTD